MKIGAWYEKMCQGGSQSKQLFQWLSGWQQWTAIFLIAYSVSAFAQSDPLQLLRQIAANMIHGLQASQATLKTNPQVIYSLVNRYVVPYADITEMSKRVLPPVVWNRASSAQQAQFKQVFTSLLIRTYASALAAYRDQVITFYPIRGGAGPSSVEVMSQITSPHNPSPIHVTYRLLQRGGQWRLYDLAVEGVSLLASYHAQFADILATNGQNLDRLLQVIAQGRSGAQR